MRKIIERLLVVGALLINTILVVASSAGPLVLTYGIKRAKCITPEPSSEDESLGHQTPLQAPINPNEEILKELGRQDSLGSSAFGQSDCGTKAPSDCPTRITDCGTKAPSSAGSFSGIESLRKVMSSRRSLDAFFDEAGNPIHFPTTPLTGRNLSTPGNSSPLKSSRFAGLLSPSSRLAKK